MSKMPTVVTHPCTTKRKIQYNCYFKYIFLKYLYLVLTAHRLALKLTNMYSTTARTSNSKKDNGQKPAAQWYWDFPPFRLVFLLSVRRRVACNDVNFIAGVGLVCFAFSTFFFLESSKEKRNFTLETYHEFPEVRFFSHII